MVNEEKVLEIEIEPGMRDRQEYPFIAEGMISINAISIMWRKLWCVKCKSNETPVILVSHLF